jgi:hypothetical protein
MKALIACLFACLSFFQPSIAQGNVIIKVDSSFNYEKISLPFKEIIVADARFDQTKLGYIHTNNFLERLVKKRAADFPDSLRNYLPKVIASFSERSDTSSESLFILIKKFRIAENLMSSVQETINNYLTLNLSASFYSLKDGKCTRLFSVDDVFMENVDIKSDIKISLEYYGNQRAAILTKMLYKLLANKTWQKQASGVAYNLNDVNLGIQKRFSLNIYRQQAGAGLYKTFAEFRNASPSVTGIKIKYKDDKIEEVLDEDGNKVLLHEFWGLSDGKKNYLIFRKEFTELIPSGKSYCVLSYRTHAELTGRAIMGDGRYSGFLGSLNGGKKIKEYFDLDMDTGEVFLEEVFGKSKLKNLSTGISK